jgi:hypothetical protein
VTGASTAILGAIAGALITGLSAVVISYYQRASARRDEHRLRAFDRHLAAYERIFVTCRSTLDAFSDYMLVDKKVSDRSDPFLRQLLEILRDCAYQYCVAVDWRHNPGMAYLDLKLEEKCLHLRDLLLLWLSGPRLSYGDIASVRRNGQFTVRSAQEIRRLAACDYEELRIERQVMVVHNPADYKLISDIRKNASSVIQDLKDVMSH